MNRFRLLCSIAGMLLFSGCYPSAPTPPPASLPITGATGPQAAPVTLASTATAEGPLPAGWTTHTSQQCEYTIGHPSDMQVIEQTPYSDLLVFSLADPEQGARNFLYVSVIAPQIQDMASQGAYDHSVYNYDPAATGLLLNMQVGESKPVHEVAALADSFTYQRLPDTTLGGQAARTYENLQPWEFPLGTKEIRYYVSLEECIYLVGGYMDTAGSDQPGTLSEDLFHQIVDTIQLAP